MKTCMQCGKQFPSRIVVGGVGRNVGNRKYHNQSLDSY